MSDVYEIAVRLLTGADYVVNIGLAGGLYAALTDADVMVQRAGGCLRSRQAIAAIIVGWQAANPDTPAIFPGDVSDPIESREENRDENGTD